MKISNYINNTNPIMERNTTKTKQTSNPTSEKPTAGQAVKLSISDEAMESYRSLLQQNRQESYDDMLKQRELLKSEKIRDIDYSYEISKKATDMNKEAANAEGRTLSFEEKTKNYATAYANLRNEIIKGYESGRREIYVADENGTRKLTRDEELGNLDAAYKITLDEFTTREKTNVHAREIIGREINKIAGLH